MAGSRSVLLVKRWDSDRVAMEAAARRSSWQLNAAMNAHRGRVFRASGEASAAVFVEPRDALSAALAAQRALASEDFSAVGGIFARMAIHTGSADLRADDYVGPAVNRAAQLLAIGHGGHVFLLADSAFALACNSHGPVTVAAGADVSFLAPVAEGDVLTARAVERGVFGRSGIYDVTVTRGGAEGAEGASGTEGTGDTDGSSGSGSGSEQIVAEFRGRSRVITGR